MVAMTKHQSEQSPEEKFQPALRDLRAFLRGWCVRYNLGPNNVVYCLIVTVAEFVMADNETELRKITIEMLMAACEDIKNAAHHNQN
jgi:hypothetical protein